MSRVALSTCWLSHRHDDGYAMLSEMADLGFNDVELSHGIRITLVDGILKAIEEGWIRAGSVHNFCPLPPGVMSPAPNLYQPTDRDPKRIALWRRLTVQTMEFAHRIGAERVIVHCGSVFFFWNDPEEVLKKRRPSEAEPVPHEVVTRQLERVRRKSREALERLVGSLASIGPYAAELGLRLCLENREGFTETPLDEDWPELLGRLRGHGPFDYWHDCGHAQIKQQLGVASQDGLLSVNHPNLGGFHLHDVTAAGDDHVPIGSGEVDFGTLATFARAHHRIVIEPSPRWTSADVKNSRDQLDRIFGEQPAAGG